MYVPPRFPHSPLPKNITPQTDNHHHHHQTIVGINSWVAHRSPTTFGHDAHLFNPDRWLTADKEALASMDRNWMPFGLGARTCIGRHISFLEMSKLVPTLVRDFDFELADPLQSDGAQWATRNYWFVKPMNFFVRVAVRGSGQGEGAGAAGVVV